MLIKDFDNTIDVWINELKKYNFNQLCIKPSQNSWSLGQVYIHLIAQTNFYLEQITICLSNNANIQEEKSSNAKIIFENNDFPDEVIEGPPSNSNTPQPNNKD